MVLRDRQRLEKIAVDIPNLLCFCNGQLADAK